MTFRVGQKVVCVDASGGFRNMLGRKIDTKELVEGAVYTIRWVGISSEGALSPTLAVRLEEIVRGHTYPTGYRVSNLGSDIPWAARRFRPIVERKTDISIFTKMLTPEGVDA